MKRSHFIPPMNTPTTKPMGILHFSIGFFPFSCFYPTFWLWQVSKDISGRLIGCLVRRGGRKLERSPKETRMEMLSIWLALSCLPDMEHGIFTNTETTGKGMGAICPFSNSISGTSVTMRNHLCHSIWHCLTVPNFSCNTRRTQRVTAQKMGMSGALQTLELACNWDPCFVFLWKKSLLGKVININLILNQTNRGTKWNLTYGKERKIPSFKQENNRKNEKLHCSESN